MAELLEDHAATSEAGAARPGCIKLTVIKLYILFMSLICLVKVASLTFFLLNGEVL